MTTTVTVISTLEEGSETVYVDPVFVVAAIPSLTSEDNLDVRVTGRLDLTTPALVAQQLRIIANALEDSQ